MSPTVTLKLQHWSHASPKQAAELRSSAATLAEFLESGQAPRVGLGVYWHAVPYLIERIPSNLDEPYRWFIEGGEAIGRNDAGDVRYLSPTQVARLARALKGEEPDELGYDNWDEAKMDALGVYPSRWLRDGQESDLLGTIRELYSYVRGHVEAAHKKKTGLVVHLTHETITDDDGDAATPSAAVRAAASVAVPASSPQFGDLILAGAQGRAYYRADAARHPRGTPKVLQDGDSAMAAGGLRHVGDFTPGDTPGDTIRAYLSEDHTVVAIFYLSARAVGGYQLFCLLEGDALVSASSAFVAPITKRRFFADFLQNVGPATLHAALLARRAKLAKKYGQAATLEPTLEACVGVWEGHFARLQTSATE